MKEIGTNLMKQKTCCVHIHFLVYEIPTEKVHINTYAVRNKNPLLK